VLILVIAFAAVASPAFAAAGEGTHGEPIAALLLSLAIVLVAAKLGGHLARRLGQPAALGELVSGVLLGNLSLVGYTGFEPLRANAPLDTLAQFGVILLLFQVGLESTVAQMLQVGLSSLLVATFGVIGPFIAGWLVGVWLLPDASAYAHMFLGATLTATSVGITARVLKDLGKSHTAEARIILGAAVIDDVLGLVILAVVAGVVAAANQGQALSYGAIALVLLKAATFLVVALALGVYLSRRLFWLASRLEESGVLLAIGLAFCFTVAWLGSLIGLAPIVGAFAAGLVLEDLHYRPFVGRGERSLNELIEPIASFLVPVFFVTLGARTDLRVFGQAGVFGLAATLTVAAILGKQLCALGVIGRGYDRLSIALGMTPRGEVGLIFANIGLTLVVAGVPVVDEGVFSAVVAMVIATTVITPPALKWSFGRSKATSRRQAEA
jgi:Kef-type K+ transport system membrane component KefB